MINRLETAGSEYFVFSIVFLIFKPVNNSKLTQGNCHFKGQKTNMTFSHCKC